MILTPSRPQGSRQLALSTAPKIDRYGLHALDCECTRCQLGHRPSAKARDHARVVWERRERERRAAELAKEAIGKEPTRAEVNAAQAAERTRRRLEREAAEAAARVKADEEARRRAGVPPQDELDDLKRQYGLRVRPRRT